MVKRTCFDNYHPLVPALYFLFVIALTMLAFHPILIGVSFIAGIVCNAYLRGIRPVLRTLRWQMCLFLVVALVNPLVSSRGSTLLFVLGPDPLFHLSAPIYAESVAYGVCMGGMLVAMMLWFSNAASVMTSDRVMVLTGRRIPTIGLMMTMVTRLVPQFVRRGTIIADAASATTAAATPNARLSLFAESEQDDKSGSRHEISQGAPDSHPLAMRVRQISVLMGWSMEDSLETADAMKARGWGAALHRTTYERNPFTVVDGTLLVSFGALAVAVSVASYLACSQAAFYPVVGLGSAWPVAAVLYALVFVGFACLEVREWLAWR